MFKKIIEKGRKIILEPQGSVLSAATLIMFMIIASRVLGLVRQRTLAHFFTPDDLSLFFAAFRLPDLIFEVLVFGTFSSAFIPVFSKSIKKGNGHAWGIASSVLNIGILAFAVFAIFMSIFAKEIYGVFAPGYSLADREKIAGIARWLFAAQGFFVMSYVLTGVLESLRRFLIPSLAPLFYNLGIIIGTVVFSKDMQLMGPTLGVIIGASSHFLIQLPVAIKSGFRFKPRIKIDEDVRTIGKLALPRLLEVGFLQISKVVELFFSSFLSKASYAYYTFGNTLQLLPVGLFGTSIAKAALPTLSRDVDDREKFNKTLLSSLNQLIFLALPASVFLIILRVPVVRLVYGTEIFSWAATIQTGYVLSTFASGVVFQAAISLLSRAFYAQNDTKTPVSISILTIIAVVVMDFVLIRVLKFEVWGLALAFTVGSVFQCSVLFCLLNKRYLRLKYTILLKPFVKSLVAAVSAGAVMFLILKFFDRSVWVKRLSFLTQIEATKNLPFEKFVLDTRYTSNLLILTFVVSVIGLFTYFIVAAILKSEELGVFLNLLKRTFIKRQFSSIPQKETENVIPTPAETTD
ncbi:MAG: putative peptidoglycan lipid II flippase MurJ [Candidatus Woesebacteria bacterium GW2011_GWA1_39_21]|uniref:Probable lipid II flippase MurJ n=1 Tax=Candidatus Woesebacteria bacterium GW2011_GWA1_39_21 TaxID=1618550 RepID=A0A0G0N8C7_9BACT|nr:MAG: putative peptidoglycan lipid II flippase MurJ [Candidatus Woesebacteria bacterium GW2011_GWA1_39_21]